MARKPKFTEDNIIWDKGIKTVQSEGRTPKFTEDNIIPNPAREQAALPTKPLPPRRAEVGLVMRPYNTMASTASVAKKQTNGPIPLTSSEIKARMDAREAEWERGIPADIQAEGDRRYKSRYDELVSQGVDSLVAETEAGKARQDYFLDSNNARKSEKAKMAGAYYNARVKEEQEKLASNGRAAQAFEDIYRLDDVESAIRGVLAIAERGGAPVSEWQEAADAIAHVLGLTVEAAGGFDRYAETLRGMMHSGELDSRRSADEKAVIDSGLDLDLLKEARERQSKAEQAQARREVIEKETKRDPFGMNAVSVLLSPLQGVEYASQLLGNIGHNDTNQLESYRPLDVNDMPLTDSVAQVRGTTAKNIDNKVLSWLYENGMSIADSSAQIAALGPASVFLMGGSAAANQMKDVLERGGTNRQAMISGAAAGAAEMLFEKFSIDNLLAQKSVTGWKSWLAETAKQSGVEASEEAFTEIANILSDAAIMGENSDFSRNVSNYAAQGYAPREAKKRAFLDSVGQVALAAAGGAFSGGVMGGAVNALNGVSNSQNPFIQAYEMGLARQEAAKAPQNAQEAQGSQGVQTANPVGENAVTPRVGGMAEAESQTETVGHGNPVIDAYNWAVQERNNREVDAPAEGQKNTALSAGAESTAVNTNPALHTAAEQKTIAEYQSSVDETIKDFIDEYLENPNKGFSRKNISSVGERQASDAKSLLGGDYVGYKNAINSNAIKHILNEHGPNGTVDHSMSDANDIARVGYVLDNYDNVEVVEYASGDQDFSREFRDKNNNPAPMLKFSKKVNGTYYVVEAIPESQYKKIWVVSAYMQTDSGTQAPNANGPRNTPNASLASSLSATDTVSQPAPNVNTEAVEQATPGTDNAKAYHNIGAAERGFTTPTRGEIVYTQNKTMDAGPDITSEESERYAPGVHETMTDEMSLERATGRLYQDENGHFVNLEDTVDELLEKESWTGVDQDTAQIAFRWMNAHRQSLTEDQYNRFWALHKVIEEIGGTEAGRSLQARQKWVDSGDGIVSKAMSIMDDPRIDRKAAREVIDHVSELAEKYDRAAASGNDIAYFQIIRETALERNTSKVRKNGEIKKTAEWAMKQIKAAGDVEFAKNAARASIIAMAQDYVPVSKTAKLKAFRRDAMLSKISTWARNVVSNNAFDPVDSIARDISVPLDMLLSKFTKTRSVALDLSWFSKAKRSGAKYGAAKSFLEVALDISAEGAESKYGQTGNRTFRMNGGIFERFMSQWEKISNYAMYSTDQMQKGSIQSGVQRGIDRLYQKGKIADDSLRDAGAQEATFRTFQEDSAISKGLLAVRRGLNGVAHVGDLGLGDIMMPFVQVPANLVDITVDYSPLGFARGLYRLTDTLIDAHKGNMTAAQQARAVQTIGRSVTGTAVLALAVLARMKGAIIVSDDGSDEDKDKSALESQDGLKGTQLNLSGLRRIFAHRSGEYQAGDILMSISFMDPFNALLNMGSLIADDYMAEHDGEKNEITFGEVMSDAAAGVTQSVMDLPMMSPFAEAAEAHQYSKADTEGGRWLDAAKQFAAGQASSLIPNSIKGLAQGMDTKQRDQYFSGSLLGRTWDSIKAGIPGLRQTLPVKLNSFGKEMDAGNPALNILNNNILPGSIVQYSPQNENVEKLMSEIYEATGSVTQYPDKNPPNSIDKDVNGDGKTEKFALSSADKRQYKTTYGGIIEDLVSQVYDRKNLFTKEEALEILTGINTYARAEAKNEFFEENDINEKSPTNFITKAVAGVQDADIPFVTYLDFWIKKGNLTYEVDEKGERKVKEAVVKLIDSMNLTDKQKDWLFASENYKNPPAWH